MSKSITIFFIFLIIFSFIFNFHGVYATDINMNLVPNDISEDNEIEGNETNTISQNNQQDQLSSNTDRLTSPSSVGSVTEEGLSFSNILSILLITVGIVLILLAIAIIIRLK